MKTMNRELVSKNYYVMEFIRRNGCPSRAQIASVFRMNVTTAGNIIERLLRENALREIVVSSENDVTPVGRPPIGLEVNPEYACFIGLNFSGDSVRASLVDFAGNQLVSKQRHFMAGVDKNHVLKVLSDLLNEFLNDYKKCNRICAVGLGIPGTVDTVAGIGIIYPRIKNWENVPVTEILGIECRLPVFADHNSNCFAIGESNVGHGAKSANMVSITVRTGISMGIVRNHEVFNMSKVSAGELGHITVNPNGEECWCGNRGCLETVVSGWALQKYLRRHGFADGINDNTTIEEFIGMAENGNFIAERVLVEMFKSLGIAVVDVARLLRPELIVINGIFNHARNLLKSTLEATFKERASILNASTPDLIISKHDDAIGAAGAAIMAISKYYNPLYKIYNN